MFNKLRELFTTRKISPRRDEPPPQLGSDITSLMQKAFSMHQSGELQQAAEIYQLILNENPEDYDANYLLGTIEVQLGKNDDAKAHFQSAISANPQSPLFHKALADLFIAEKNWIDAEPLLNRAAALDPHNAKTLNDLAAAQEALGKIADAICTLQAALRQEVTLPQAHYNLARLLRKNGDRTEALKHFHIVLTLVPTHIPTLIATGQLHNELNTPDDAEPVFQKALEIDANCHEAKIGLALSLTGQKKYVEAKQLLKELVTQEDLTGIHYNLGVCEQNLGNLIAAELEYKAAITETPDSYPPYQNLGCVLMELRREDEAQTCLTKAMELAPQNPDSYVNLSTLYQANRDYDKALTLLNQALTLSPTHSDAHWNRALALLNLGRLAEAWDDYEWRWKAKCLNLSKRDLSGSEWTGELVLGKTLLIYTEQGLGDSINFIRYASLAAERCLRVHVLCPPPLANLFKSVKGIDQAIPDIEGTPLPNYDLHIPLLSLPRLFRTDLSSIPSDTPYIYPAPEKVRAWGYIIGDLPKLKVGLVWAGGAYFKNDRERSCKLEMFSSLTRIQGVQFFCLQKGPASEQCSKNPDIEIQDLSPLLEDFTDTAAAISCLDLVISVDTAVAHLAGALGKPTWTLLAFANDWRWLQHRNDSPWYPTMRLFRQDAPGDWDGIIQKLTSALTEVAMRNQST